MSEWKPIEEASKDGRWIDGFNAHTGERMVTRWQEWPFGPGSLIRKPGWLMFGSPGPTHFQPLPTPQEPTP